MRFELGPDVVRPSTWVWSQNRSLILFLGAAMITPQPWQSSYFSAPWAASSRTWKMKKSIIRPFNRVEQEKVSITITSSLLFGLSHLYCSYLCKISLVSHFDYPISSAPNWPLPILLQLPTNFRDHYLTSANMTVAGGRDDSIVKERGLYILHFAQATADRCNNSKYVCSPWHRISIFF